MTFDLVHVPFIRSPHFTPAHGRPIDLVVIHDMEAPETLHTAEDTARYFQGQRQASAHYNVDADSVVQSVRVEDVAWHAPGANHNGIGIEHAGYAKQTTADWLDLFGIAMLGLSARLTAALCARHSIPVTFLDAGGLTRTSKPRGITTHAAVSEAWHKTNHWDPGGGFPLDWYLSRVTAELHGVAPTNPPRRPSTPAARRVLRLLSPMQRGVDVMDVQNKCRGWAWILRDAALDCGPADSVFGRRTDKAVRAFQHRARLTNDGIVGPVTWAALHRI